MLSGDDVTQWLNPLSPRDRLDEVIKPTQEDVFQWHPVTAEVGSTRASHEGLITPDPLHGAKPEPQLSLF